MDTDGRLKFLQWNVNGIRAKNHHLRAAAGIENVDVFLLQETKLPSNSTFRIPGFTAYTTPKVREGPRGLATLIRDNILSKIVPHPIHCGEGVEVLAVKIYLDDCSLYIYNIYRKPDNTTELCLGELFAEASREIILIGGDFNANHPDFNPRQRADAAGTHLASTLDGAPELSLLNSTEPTHIHGGVLDLTFVTTDLLPSTTWQLHPTLSSDHFATITSINRITLPRLPLPPPRWDLKRADWKAFEEHLQNWFAAYHPDHDNSLNQAERDLVEAFHEAARQCCPLLKQQNRHFKDHWYYDERVKEQYHRVNMTRKFYRKHPVESNRELLQAVITITSRVIKSVMQEKWKEWCTQLNEHTSLSTLWNKLRSIAGSRKKQEEAERLVSLFASRAATDQLPR